MSSPDKEIVPEIFNQVGEWIEQFPKGEANTFTYKGASATAEEKDGAIVFHQGNRALKIVYRKGSQGPDRPSMKGDTRPTFEPSIITISDERTCLSTVNSHDYYPEETQENPFLALAMDLMNAYDTDPEKRSAKDLGLLQALRTINDARKASNTRYQEALEGMNKGNH